MGHSNKQVLSERDPLLQAGEHQQWHDLRRTCTPGMMQTWFSTGLGFMTDAYDLFIINVVLTILGEIYSDVKQYKSYIATAVLVGTVVGNSIIGAIADKIGRKRGMVLSMSIILVGTLGSSLSFGTSHVNILTALCIWRFVLGIGIGGEYPLSAAYAAENAESAKTRGLQVAATFSAQGLGALIAPIVGLVCVVALPLRLAWRVCLGGVSVLCTALLVFRLFYLPESVKYQNAESKPLTLKDKFDIVTKQHLKSIIGTSISWFLLDIAFYANGLFSSQIIKMAGVHHLPSIMLYTMFLALAALPGYFVAIAIIEKVGRVRLQCIGFMALAIVYFILAFTYDDLVKGGHLDWFIAMYALTFFISNVGPNTTTFVLPSELFPTQVRGTCHGFSAACGKMGAIVGVYALGELMTPPHNDTPLVMYICAAVSVVGLVVTLLFLTETKGTEMPEVHDTRDAKGMRAIP